MLGRNRVASYSRGSSVIQSSWCSSIPLVVTVFGHMEEGGGVKKGLWDVFTFNTSRQPQLEPTLTTRIITSARSTGAQDCVEPRSPVASRDLTEMVLSIRFSSRIICQGLESHQSEIVKRLRSTPRLPTVQRANGPPPLPSPPLGVVMEWLTALEDGSRSGQLEGATGVDHLQHPMRKTTTISEQRGVCVTSKRE